MAALGAVAVWDERFGDGRVLALEDEEWRLVEAVVGENDDGD